MKHGDPPYRSASFVRMRTVGWSRGGYAPVGGAGSGWGACYSATEHAAVELCRNREVPYEVASEEAARGLGEGEEARYLPIY